MFYAAECQGYDYENVISAFSAGHSSAVRGVQTGGIGANLPSNLFLCP
jgi:hypothetical protein